MSEHTAQPAKASTFALYRVAGLLAVPPTLILVIGLLAPWWWFGDLMSHFRWHAFLSLSGLVLVPLVMRRWLTACAIGVPLLVASFLVLPWVFSGSPVRTTADRELRVVSLNLLHTNRDVDAVGEWLAASNADVVVLLEVNHWWAKQIESFDGWGHRSGLPRDDAFGLLVLSRRPWTSDHLLYLGEAGVPTVTARFPWHDQELLLIATHPIPPMSPRNHHYRNDQLAAIATVAAEHAGPLVIAGDLNCTPWSPYLSQLCAQAGVVDSGRGRLPIGTWPAALGALGLPIDHVLVSPDLAIAQRQIGASVNSDHRPVVIDLVAIDSSAGP